MAPPFLTSSSPTLTPAYSTHSQYQYNTQKKDMFSNQFNEDPVLQLCPIQDLEEVEDVSVESTEVTIETNVDPVSESTTTTTVVHLPFHVTHQCDPPKVISWMKVEDPKRANHLKNRSRHHPHQRSGQNFKFFHNIFPFLEKEERSSKKKQKEPKKNDGTFITLFSIQVSVLGRVNVSPSASTPDDTQVDLGSKRTVSAHLDRSETTSYVIHRTFEDFEHLSKMVLRLENTLHTRNSHRNAASAPQSEEAPELTALNVHHPHSGLFQALLKQYSTAKANQRAFDASSTTHGFNEEGAFERILELNQYLENVWYWLLPENTPQQLNLSVEQQLMIQWFMPSPKSAHADGRQMKERQDQDSKWQDLQRQYGPRSRQQEQLTNSTSSSEASTSSSSAATVEVAQTSVTSPHHVEHNKLMKGSTKYDSLSSLPSLTSSASSSSSVSMASDEDRNGRDYDNHVHNPHVTNSRRTSSTIINSPDPFLKRFHKNNGSPSHHFDLDGFEDIPVNSTDGGQHQHQHQHHQEQQQGGEGSHPSSEPNKIKRRISISHVLRSLSNSKNNNSNNGVSPKRQSMHDMASKRVSTASFKSTGSPVQEICIWNTVTVKHSPVHFSNSIVRSPSS
ncbi:hypothetical protein BGX27_005094 [Mortierella sp. AM989]|nr:hypothetical protein BGX27_005094 [Mortierella sp. AM989]